MITTHHIWIRASPRSGGPSRTAPLVSRSRNTITAYRNHTITASAIGVERPNSTVLSVTWPADSTVPLPGGTIGASTKITSGVAMMLATSQIKQNAAEVVDLAHRTGLRRP